MSFPDAATSRATSGSSGTLPTPSASFTVDPHGQVTPLGVAAPDKYHHQKRRILRLKAGGLCVSCGKVPAPYRCEACKGRRKAPTRRWLP